MTLKEYMAECEMFENLPRAVIRMVALREYQKFEKTLEDWYEDKDGEYGFCSVWSMYAQYAQKNEEDLINLKPLIGQWLGENDLWSKNMGEEVNDGIRHYYLFEKSSVPENEIPEFSNREIASLFENDFLSVPTPGFYDFFNPGNYTRIPSEIKGKTKNFPYLMSKKRIVKKVKKHKYAIIANLNGFFLRGCDAWVSGGKSWRESLIELARKRISEAVGE